MAPSAVAHLTVTARKSRKVRTLKGRRNSYTLATAGAHRRRQEQRADKKVADNVQAHKRSKPLRVDSASNSGTMQLVQPQQPVHTPHIRTHSLPQAAPTQSSPARSTPGSASKTTVVKALPTVRDHTTDQLSPSGDEYIPREIDQDGETKVSHDGYPLEGRKFRCRTFQVPNRGEKLFMLATECARVLGYRDSYLLFNKNRSLYKIIANQQEKDNLIHQEILPYSYRSRQIAIVTARSMFRQFGSRLIESGRRVRDDYWEAKAKKQGFTEEDLAGEKRPGAAKAREQAAAEANQATLAAMPQGEVIYNGVGIDGQPPELHPVSLAPLPMIHLPSDELRPGAYGNTIRPRQEITGPPYQDRTLPSDSKDIHTQAAMAAEYNKSVGQTRDHRANYLKDYWNRPHEQPVTLSENSSGTVAPQNLTSAQAVAGLSQSRGQQDQMSHSAAQMIAPAYSGYSNQQNPMASPVQSMHRQMPSATMAQGSPMGVASGHRQTPSYGGYGGNMWPPPQPQPSPLSQSHHPSQYGQQHHQSPMPPPQMSPQSGLNYAQLGQMGNPAFTGMNRSMYQPSPSPQQFGMQSSAAQQAGMQGWATTGSGGGSLPQDWQRFQ